jgi:hypothetical protein
MGEVDFNLQVPDYPTGRQKILYGILASAHQFKSESFQFGVSVLHGPGTASLGDRAQSFEKAWWSHPRQSKCPRIFIPVALCDSVFSHG